MYERVNDIEGSYNFKCLFFFSCAVHMKLILGKGIKETDSWMDSLKPNIPVRIHLSCEFFFSFRPPVGPGLDHILSVPIASYKASKRCFCWDRKNRGPLSQQVWHDKDPSLIRKNLLILKASIKDRIFVALYRKMVTYSCELNIFMWGVNNIQ